MNTPLYYKTWGNPKNRPLLFLHGFMGSHADWLPFMPTLSESYFCIAIDFPGHGNSVLESYSIADIPALLNQTLQVLAIETCTLIGYSMGGRMALLFATTFPGRVHALFLLSTSLGLKTATERTLRQTEDAQRAIAIEQDYPTFLENWYRQPLFQHLTTQEETLKRIIKQRLLQNPNHLATALRALGTGKQPPLWEAFKTFPKPWQLLVGELDENYVALGKAMAKTNPRGFLTIVPYTSHSIHEENPIFFLDCLQTFLQQT